MKITFLVSQLSYGGIEKSIASLSKVLDKDFDLEIISVYKIHEQPPFNYSSKVKFKYLIDNDRVIRIRRYKHLLKKKKYSKTLRLVWDEYLSTFSIIKLFKDIVKANKTLHKKKKLVIKAIKETSSDFFISTTAELHSYLSKVKKKNSTRIAWEHTHHGGDASLASDIIESVKDLDYLVTVSQSLKDFYSQKLEKTSCKCVCIPNILDEVPHHKATLNNNRIISIGKLSKEKGFDDLIDVIKLVRRKVDVRLDIVGGGHEMEHLKNKIRNKSLENAVYIHGYQTHEVIEKMLEEASIYVLASKKEAFGLTLLEAMSHALPVVVFSSAEGACELIDDKSGIIIEGRNKEKMAEAIVKLLEDSDLRHRLGNRSYKKAKKFTGENIKKEWLKILK